MLTVVAGKARKVLELEQRTGHEDRAVRPGGLEVFIGNWLAEINNQSSDEQLSQRLHTFRKLFDSYHHLDQMQRAAKVRAGLAMLDTIFPNDQQKGSHQIGNTTIKANGEWHRAALETQPLIQIPSLQKTASPQIKKRAPVRKSSPVKKVHSENNDTTKPGHKILDAPVTSVPGIGPNQGAKLKKLEIQTVRDLIQFYPREHRDYSKLTKIADIPFQETVTIMGLIWEATNVRTGGGRVRTVARISDETGQLRVTWFNQSFLLKQLQPGTHIVITGVKQRFGNKVEFNVKSYEFPDQGDLLNTGRLVPVYSLTDGLSAKAMRKYTKWAVDRCTQFLEDYLPAAVKNHTQLIGLADAISQYHYPDNIATLQKARARLSFDELFLIQLGMTARRATWRETTKGIGFQVNPHIIFSEAATSDSPDSFVDNLPEVSSTLWRVSRQPFETSLPFSFTNAQKRVLEEIFQDIRQEQPMCRLLQGDVGSGKTVVAAATLLISAMNGYQGVLMAPTEILAEQHAQSISNLLEPYGIQTVLMSGSMKQSEKNAAREALNTGQALVAIGTHALIQDDVIFQKLGLVIVDEQHRFGVEQRDTLRQKGYNPHMLVMTATPIPRTLALTLYGDLDISTIDEMPKGRQQIITKWRAGMHRQEAYDLVANQVAEGRQAFIICPLIEESESLEVKAATVEYGRLQREVFPDLRLGLLHGAMKSAEKDSVMRLFRDGDIDVLVATSVVEVGIDVPNATVMLIEDADRFGLSQLHQFRGRVGRGRHQSYCYLLSQDASLQARDRLEVMEKTNNGFELAEEDLRLRGPGDFWGTRQSGLPELRVANLADTKIIQLSRNEAERLWEEDPGLIHSEHLLLRQKLEGFWQTFAGH